MSALQPTRRRLLSGILTGAVGLLAGCSGDSTHSATTEGRAHGPGLAPPPEATLDFEVRSVRLPTDEPFVRFSEDDEDAEDDEGDAPRARGRQLVHQDDQASALRFDTDRDGVDPADVDEEALEDVRSFVESTDYETASVIVYQRPIQACYRRHLRYVVVQPDRYYLQFCRELLDATTHCEVDRREMDAQFARVPRAYESPPSSHGAGESAQCRGEFWTDGENA